MSRLTVFLARFIGLLAILVVAGMYVRGPAIIDASVSETPIMLMYAIISLLLGLAMVVGHNVWRGGLLPVVVTLVGWMIFAKGCLLLFMGPEAVAGYYGAMHYGAHVPLYLIPAAVVGLYLTIAGFAARSPD